MQLSTQQRLQDEMMRGVDKTSSCFDLLEVVAAVWHANLFKQSPTLEHV